MLATHTNLQNEPKNRRENKRLAFSNPAARLGLTAADGAGQPTSPFGCQIAYHFRTGFSVSQVPLNPAGITKPSPMP